MTWTFVAQAGLYLAAACAFPVCLMLWLDRDFRRRWGDRPGEGRLSQRRSWRRDPGSGPAE